MSFFLLNPPPPHNSQRIDANTDATNNTTKTTHTNITKHNQTQTHHPFPTQIHAHFIPSGTRFAQLFQDSVSCTMRTCSPTRNEPRPTHSDTHKSEPCVHRESRLDERSLSLLLREKRREKRKRSEREREKCKGREREERTREREKERRRPKKKFLLFFFLVFFQIF